MNVKKKISCNLLCRTIHSEKKAQSEAVFRLMIDSVVGLAILVIIISAINYYNEQSCLQSTQDLIDLIKSAANSSTGAIIPSQTDICFSKGSALDALDTQHWTNINETCFRFQYTGSSSVRISPDEKRIDFIQNLKTRVYAQCKPSPSFQSCNPKIIPQSIDACCITCTISIGKKIENE